MKSKDAPVVLDGVCLHIPQKAIGSILQLSSKSKGFIMTAYITDRITEGVRIWKKSK
jgi:hypothetical protein